MHLNDVAGREPESPQPGDDVILCDDYLSGLIVRHQCLALRMRLRRR